MPPAAVTLASRLDAEFSKGKGLFVEELTRPLVLLVVGELLRMKDPSLEECTENAVELGKASKDLCYSIVKERIMFALPVLKQYIADIEEDEKMYTLVDMSL